ncbi:MAG: hypothetical protein ACREMQ_09535 [Longimicrobiales bacterium]
MRIDIEAWAPEYGAPIDTETLAPTGADVDIDVELPAADWRPLDAGEVDAARRIAFVDGVRRIDARVWVTHDDGTTRMGICASFAAGLVRCDGPSARILAAEVRRGLFTTAGAPHLETRAGTYHAFATASDDIDKLSQGLQERMAILERDVAATFMGDAASADTLIVLDGPLTGKLDLTGAVGYVKTHRVAYLPQEASDVIARLAPSQRSPLFVTQGAWSRYSWYLRLENAGGHPWAGVVRCEATAELALPDARNLADRTARSLPRFASAPHKDPRAPQNLYPIGGLERELRRRLGDAGLIYRSLRTAAL